MKTQVYALGKDLGIMEEIMTAAPTDGLWEDNRTDESQIGARNCGSSTGGRGFIAGVTPTMWSPTITTNIKIFTHYC